MNWVGGVAKPQTALSILASGGVPVRGIVEGGEITKVRIQHVWVETYVPYGYYRGTRIDQSDKAWIPLDPSFKKYEHKAGRDLASIMEFDPVAFLAEVASTATIDPARNSVTNADYRIVTSKIYNTTLKISDHMKVSNLTMQDLAGGSNIIPINLGMLPASLPYQVIAIHAEYSDLPSTLQHKLGIELVDKFGITSFFTVTKPLAELAGQRNTLSFDPASSSDLETMTNLVLQKASSVPAYLINVIPKLKLNGSVIGLGEALPLQLGSTTTLRLTFSGPNIGTESVQHNIVAGSFHNIVLDLGKMSSRQLQEETNKIEAAKQRFEAGGGSAFDKDEVLGSILQSTGTSYWLQYDFMRLLFGQLNNVVSVHLPSAGLFSQEGEYTYLFGIPLSATLGGNTVDIKRNLSAVVSKEGDPNRVFAQELLIGMLGSYLEAGVYDQYSKVHGAGISAANAMLVANQRGIPIQRIDSANIATMLPSLNIPVDVKGAIASAVATGKIAFTPIQPIAHNGWVGVGYIILDPVNGSGAYLISGGLAGGYWKAILCFIQDHAVPDLTLAQLAVLAFSMFILSVVVPEVGLATATIVSISVALYALYADVNKILNSNLSEATKSAGILIALVIAGATMAVSMMAFGEAGIAIGGFLTALVLAIGDAYLFDYLNKIDPALKEDPPLFEIPKC
jgi:hypothetical protein